MTAIVILNVIGATLIVTTIVSLLAWAVVSDRRALVLRPVRPPRATRRRTRRLPAPTAIGLR